MFMRELRLASLQQALEHALQDFQVRGVAWR
jgi:hypothetical protein